MNEILSTGGVSILARYMAAMTAAIASTGYKYSASSNEKGPPVSVSSTRREFRVNSPSSSSRSLICWLNAGCET